MAPHVDHDRDFKPGQGRGPDDPGQDAVVRGEGGIVDCGAARLAVGLEPGDFLAADHALVIDRAGRLGNLAEELSSEPAGVHSLNAPNV